jgi:hypothetical protein
MKTTKQTPKKKRAEKQAIDVHIYVHVVPQIVVTGGETLPPWTNPIYCSGTGTN